MKKIIMTAIAAISLLAGMAAQAVDYTWDNGGDGTTWQGSNNWNPTGTPSNHIDIAIFDGSSTVGSTINLGTMVNMADIQVTSPSADVVLNNNTATLRIGSADMSSATRDLTITTGATTYLGGRKANDTLNWSVAAGQTFTVSWTGPGQYRMTNDTANVSGPGTVLMAVRNFDIGGLNTASTAFTAGLNVSGGTFKVQGDTQGTLKMWYGTNTINQTGGIVECTMLSMAQPAASYNNTYNLDGGILKAVYIMKTAGTGTDTFVFNGGTLQAKQDHVNFINSVLGSVRIDAGGGTIDDAGFTVKANEGMTGVGALTKTGSGTLKLTAANTYAGGTWVNAGTLVLDTAGKVASDVTVANGAAVVSSNSAAFGILTDLSIGSSGTVSLDFDGTNTISGLSLDGGTTWQADGIYGANGTTLTGSGFLQVVAPADYVWQGGGAAPNAWSDADNWSPNTGVPGAIDTAIFDSTSTNHLTVDLGSTVALADIRITSPATDVVLGTASTALKIGGVDMSAATKDLTIETAATGFIGGRIDGDTLDWNVAAGRTFTAAMPIGVGGGYRMFNGIPNVDGDGTVLMAVRNFDLGGTVAGDYAAGLNISSGMFKVQGDSVGTLRMWYGNNTISQSGGIVECTVLNMAQTATTGYNNTYNLDGGILKAVNIVKTAGTGTDTFVFNGGTLQAKQDHVNFINSVLGSVRIDAGGGTIDDAGFAIKVTEGMTGVGALTKTGAGTLTLSAASTYAGGTTVGAGTLVASKDSALGSGNVSVAGGAALVLTNGVSNDYIGDAATLSLASTATLDLAYTGTVEVVGGLSLDGGSTWLANGTYSAAALDALGSGTYTGAGSISVGAAVTYDTWAGFYGLTGGRTGDDDSDGLLNVYEYGLGGDPTNPADQGIPPVFGTMNVGGTNYFGYIHPQLSNPGSGISYHLELNSDLVFGSWTNDGYMVIGTNVTGFAMDYVTNVTTTVEGKKFVRLIIE